MEETVMQIKDMFRKKIDREIQGVIIVGQGEETNVAQELEEYVVTRELQRHFADFFAAYKKEALWFRRTWERFLEALKLSPITPTPSPTKQ